MKKLLGLEAEINITANDDIIKGLSKGAIKLENVIKEFKPEITKEIKKLFNKEN